MFQFSEPLNLKEKFFVMIDLLICFTCFLTLAIIPVFAYAYSNPLLYLIYIYPITIFFVKILLYIIARLNVGKEIKFLWITIVCNKYGNKQDNIIKEN